MNDIFPPEIIEEILSYTDRGITSKVCKLWHENIRKDRVNYDKLINKTSLGTLSLYNWTHNELGLSFNNESIQWYLVLKHHKSVMQAIYGKSSVTFNLYHATVNHPNIQMAKWLKKHEAPWDVTVFAKAMKAGNFKLIKFLRKYGCPYNSINIPVLMIQSGKPKIVKYFVQRGFRILENSPTIATNFKMLNWLCTIQKYVNVSIKPDALVKAIKHNNMECIQYIQNINKFTLFQQILVKAVKYTPIFLYLYDEYHRNYDMIIRRAIKLDNVNVFTLVHLYGKLDVYQLVSDAIDFTSIKIIKFLIENYDLNNTKLFMFCFNHLELLKVYCRKNKNNIYFSNEGINIYDSPNLFYLMKKKILDKNTIHKLRTDQFRLIKYMIKRYNIRPHEELIARLYKSEKYIILNQIFETIATAKKRSDQLIV